MRKKVLSLQELEERVLESERRYTSRAKAEQDARNKQITMDDFFQITIIKKSLIIL